MRKLFAILIFLSVANILEAQQRIVLDSAMSDCYNALDISGKTEITATAPVWAGKYNEIQSSGKSLYSFKKEHHTVWYRFRVERNCVLSFSIIPDNPKDDYDFILFKGIGAITCRSIHKGELKPIRTNISRPEPASKGVTGLGSKGTTQFVHEGRGNNWSTPVAVQAGEVYYLVLDNVYPKGNGHTIRFDYHDCHGDKFNLQEKLAVNFIVMEEGSDRLIPAYLKLIDYSKGYPNYDTVYNKRISSTVIPVEPGRFYNYEVWAKGYLSKSGYFKLDSFPKEPVKTIELRLKSVKLGGSFELKNVYFEGGKATVIRKSYPALRELLALMKDNPNLEIEIQGHVNRPVKGGNKHTEEYYNQLSIDRAKTVYDYLRKRGIDESRMRYKGFGYSQMVYPQAVTAEQMQKNRRVVIKVVKL
jgi:outer membrane protein OmpA-like peptidoglycan-associated protein